MISLQRYVTKVFRMVGGAVTDLFFLPDDVDGGRPTGTHNKWIDTDRT